MMPPLDTSPNEALRRLVFDELNWSASGLAQRIRERCRAIGQPRTVSRSTVSRWLNGSIPSPELLGPACSVLSTGARRRVTPESLGWPAAGTDLAVEALHYGDREYAVQMLGRLWELDATAGRRAVLRMPFGSMPATVLHEALVMPSDTSVAGYGRRPVREADVDLLERHTQLYGGLEASYGGGQFRSLFAAFLHQHAAPMLAGEFTDRRGRWLYGAVVDAVLALANMSVDDLLPGLAQRYDLQAMRLAQAIGDRGRLARGLIHQARLSALAGNPDDALTHARSAVVAAAKSRPSVRAYAAVTEARAWAFNGDADRTLAAVVQARVAFRRVGGAEPRWLAWLDRAELEAQAAWALARVGLVEAGEEALAWAAEMPTERTRDHVELMITGAELARLRGDHAEREALMKRAEHAGRGVSSQRLASRLAHAAQGLPRDF